MATACGLLEPETMSLRGRQSPAREEMIRRPTVLLVEDSPSDARLWAEVFGIRSDLTLRVVQTGELALDFVRRRPPFANEAPVDLVILDLGLHGASGFEVLKTMKEESATAHIPVIVFTGLMSAPSVKLAYALHANSYICKPVTIDEFEHVVRLIRDFWIDVVRLPRAS
jgi:two-component system, chemotaxis family, response regulator Rcp1